LLLGCDGRLLMAGLATASALFPGEGALGAQAGDLVPQLGNVLLRGGVSAPLLLVSGGLCHVAKADEHHGRAAEEGQPAE
jgi:hypothetical protein